jgi:hypothetical protein
MAKVSIYSDRVTCLRYDLDVACPLFRLLISCRPVSATKTARLTMMSSCRRPGGCVQYYRIALEAYNNSRDAFMILAKVLKILGNQVNGCWTKLKNCNVAKAWESDKVLPVAVYMVNVTACQ